jgi:hypothetical protein
MSTPIDVQLRRYTEVFDAQLTEIPAEDVLAGRVSPEPITPLRSRKQRTARPWVVASASALAVAVLIGGVAIALRATGGDDRPATTEPPPPPTTVSILSTAPVVEVPVTEVPITAPPATDPTSATAAPDAEFDWVTGPSLASDRADVLHDGEQFLLLEPGTLRTSRDGIDWESVTLGGSAAAATSSAEWADVDAHEGLLVRLVTNPGPGRVYLIDVASGDAREARLPVAGDSRLATSRDLRGFVAAGPAGVVAFLYDNSVTGGEMESAGFFSPDGDQWVRIEAEGLLTDAYVQPAAITSGFVALSTPENPALGSSRAWYSVNGIDWEPLATPADTTLPSGSIVSWGDTAWVHHESAFGPASLSVNPSWLLDGNTAVEITTDLPPLQTPVYGYGPAADAGDLGLVAVFGVAEPEQGESSVEWFVEVSLDGRHWTRVDLPEGLGDPNPFMSPAVGTDRVLVLVTLDDRSHLAVGILRS